MRAALLDVVVTNAAIAARSGTRDITCDVRHCEDARRRSRRSAQAGVSMHSHPPEAEQSRAIQSARQRTRSADCKTQMVAGCSPRSTDAVSCRSARDMTRGPAAPAVMAIRGAPSSSARSGSPRDADIATGRARAIQLVRATRASHARGGDDATTPAATRALAAAEVEAARWRPPPSLIPSARTSRVIALSAARDVAPAGSTSSTRVSEPA